MSLVYAARFPDKVRRLVLAGAPVDIEAGQSEFSKLAAEVPLSAFEELVRLGKAGACWGIAFSNCGVRRSPPMRATTFCSWKRMPMAFQPGTLEQRFKDWYQWTVDLPGTFFLQVVSSLFKQNQITKNQFAALGRTVDLADVRSPLFLLAAHDDELVSPPQLLTAGRLVATPKRDIETAVEPCGHLSLFLGAQTIGRTWLRMAHWLH